MCTRVHLVGDAATAHRAPLGSRTAAQVPCVLRQAELYVSAAHNETYGRSLVEALRCGLPIVTMGCSNLHVRHEDNGLLGTDESQLAAQILRVVRDGALRRRLKASVTGAQSPPDPNAQMLATVLDVHRKGAQLQAAAAYVAAPSSAPSQPPMLSCPSICMHAVDFAPPKAGPMRTPLPQVTSWHPVWSHYMLISVAVDHPERAGVVLVALATLVALAVRVFAPCCRPPCEAAAQSHGVPPKVPRRSHSPARLKEGKAD